jgi:hypothetical protein
MKILDMSAGNRAVCREKQYADAVYVDLRPSVKPTVCADTRCLPFNNGVFDLIVFDPPHVNFGKNAKLSKLYGWHTTAGIRNIIRISSSEAYRVSKQDALMAFKWNDHDQKFDSVLALMDDWWKPLFGHCVAMRTKHASSTQWMMLRRWE